jgi:hypothetical protein
MKFTVRASPVGRHDEIAPVLPVPVVDDDDHVALTISPIASAIDANPGRPPAPGARS